MAEVFTIDEEFRRLLPPLADDERERLLVEISAHGCREPLVIWKEWNILIDGHNRFEICTDLDLPFKTEEMSFTSRNDVKMWMIRNQLARRNITDANRVNLNLMLKPIIAAKAKEKHAANGGNKVSGEAKAACQISDAPLEKLNTTKEIAKASGVSHDTVHKVEAVLKKADEPTKAKMLSGEISINAAYKETKTPKLKPAVATCEQESTLVFTPLTEEDLAHKRSFTTRWFALYSAFSSKARELSKLSDANKKEMSHRLHALAKEFE